MIKWLNGTGKGYNRLANLKKWEGKWFVWYGEYSPFADKEKVICATQILRVSKKNNNIVFKLGKKTIPKRKNDDTPRFLEFKILAWQRIEAVCDESEINKVKMLVGLG